MAGQLVHQFNFRHALNNSAGFAFMGPRPVLMRRWQFRGMLTRLRVPYGETQLNTFSHY